MSNFFTRVLCGETTFRTRSKDAAPTPSPPAVPEPQPEPPKPTTRRIIKSITVVNDRTDKAYTYTNRKGNAFGLDWWEQDSKCLVIRQNLSADKMYWEALGRFTEHSVVDVEWITHNINPEKETIK